MTVYYTGNGDRGSSGLIGGKSLDKDAVLFDLIGNIDELNSQLALCILHVKDNDIQKDLDTVQDNLFSISAILANSYSQQEISKITIPRFEVLEEEIKRMGGQLPELRKFVIPGGSAASCHLHLARAIARRAERKLVTFNKIRAVDQGISTYMNRLSSFLFVCALYSNHTEKIAEKNPKYL